MPSDTFAVDLELGERDITPAESKASDPDIKVQVPEHYGCKIPSLHIAQVKRKHGLAVGRNYNTASPDGRP